MSMSVRGEPGKGRPGIGAISSRIRLSEWRRIISRPRSPSARSCKASRKAAENRTGLPGSPRQQDWTIPAGLHEEGLSLLTVKIIGQIPVGIHRPTADLRGTALNLTHRIKRGTPGTLAKYTASLTRSPRVSGTSGCLAPKLTRPDRGVSDTRCNHGSLAIGTASTKNPTESSLKVSSVGFYPGHSPKSKVAVPKTEVLEQPHGINAILKSPYLPVAYS